MSVAAPPPRADPRRTVSPVEVPGSDAVLTIERDERARLVRIACGDRVYLEERDDGVLVLGDGLAEIREVSLARGLLRHVRAGDEQWTEEYRWDKRGRPTVVDGAAVGRDAKGRVVTCGEWRYDYAGDELVAVRGPHGLRTIARGARGRPLRVREGGAGTKLEYDASGRRTDVPAAPATWSRDEYGRLWTVRDARGRVVATYIWDGWACLGRVDGPLGEPLAAAFSLDPSGTPVRVITAAGSTRIPRDAFGEALLEHEGVPGLHGGAVHGGVVHLRGRELDPRAASFSAPDPWSGLADDPRRAAGFPGVLTVEAQDAGPYTVCRNDPVGRTDPTGEVSVPLLLSTLTWSSQYNLANFVFLDLFVNFWAGLFTGQLGRWVDRSFMYSERRGNFGFRMDPVGLESWVKLFAGELRRFTLHHVFWCPSDDEAFKGLERVRAFVPGADFRPTLYGTLLRATPEHGAPFLLRGSSCSAYGIPLRADGWTRAGGTAEPVVPGSPVPAFPAGGIHFDPRGDFTEDGQHVLPDGVFGRQSGSITELEPAGTVVQGTIAAQLVLRVPRTGLGLARAGRRLFLADRAGTTTVAEVAGATERDGHTHVDLVSLPTALAPTTVRLRGLGDSRSHESLRRGSANDRLDVRDGQSTVRYAAGDVVGFAQGGNAVGGTTVHALEARLTLDTAVPAAAATPLRVRKAEAGGPSRPVTKPSADVLEFPAGQDLPAVGTAVVVASASAGAATAVRLIAAPADRQRQTDRPIAAALTGDLTWRSLSTGEELGRRDGAPEATAQVTYVPFSSGRAPASGHVVVVDAHDQIHPRDVTALDRDEISLRAFLPGDPAQPYDVDRYAFEDPDVDGCEFDQTVTLGGAAAVPGVAVVLQQLTGNAPAAGSVELVHNAALAGNRATVAYPPAAGTFPLGDAATGAPTPGQLVALEDAGHTVAPAIVQRLRLTVGLDRPLGFPAAAALECVPLKADGFEYEAEQVGPLLVSVLTTARSGVLSEIVQLPRLRVGELVRVRWDGLAAADERLYRIASAEGTTVALEGGKRLPAATPGLRVTRFVPADPETGGSRVGRNGSITATTAADCTVALDVWQPNALAAGKAVAFTDGTKTLPAFVAAVKQLDVDFHAVAGLTGATVSISALDLAADPVYVGAFTQDGARLIVPRTSLESGTKLVLAVPYVATARTQAGEFDPGTVLIPNDPEYPELSRLQALIDHELVHTEQSALWGPLLLTPFPSGAFGDLLEGLGADPDHWAMGIGHNIGRLWSIGGLMTLVEGSVISGFVWFLLKLFFFFERLFTGQPLSFGWLAHMDWLSFSQATVPDATQPNRIQVASSNGSTLSLSVDDLVEVTDGTSFRRTKVHAVDGASVDLDDPPPAASFQIAKVGSDDPTFELDSWVSTNTGLGGLQWAFDPYGEMAVRTTPEPGSFWFYFVRIARDLFGSTAWSGLPFGYFWFDNAVHNRDGHGHLSQMEQQASSESGELYSPAGRLRGRLDVVGDVARYWYFIENRHGSVVLPERQDAPGVSLRPDPRLVPAVRTNTPPGGTPPPAPEPNGFRETDEDARRPGLALPDALVHKDAALPNAAAETDPRGFGVTDRGWIPVSGRLERTSGVYVAFSAPGRHLVTTRNGIGGASDAREAQEHGKQELWFERTVADVEVRVAGTAVPRPAGPTEPLPRIRLVQRQHATIAVTPNGDRVYDAALVRPRSGLVLRSTGALEVAAQGVNGVEPVQIDRVHAYDAGTHAFATEALHARGLHLPEDLRIPVRLLEIEVVDTLPLRRAADPASDELIAVKPGDTAFVLVPAQVSRPLALARVRYPGGAPDRTRDPAPVVSAAPAPGPELAAFLGAGAGFQVAFPAGDPPEEPAELTLDVDVVGPVPAGTPPAAIGTVLGSNALHSLLTALVTLEPHFRLVNAAAAADFTVARGASITLQTTHGVTPGTVAVTPAAGVTVTKAGMNVTLAIDAAAAAGRRRVVVDDTADATHKAARTVEILP